MMLDGELEGDRAGTGNIVTEEERQANQAAQDFCTGAIKHRVEGNPDPKHVGTSYSERQNLNIRMGNRRMTRLTNAFSKKAANHDHMMAIYFMHYNFRSHPSTLEDHARNGRWRYVEALGNV
jgi:hypothetical protein